MFLPVFELPFVFAAIWPLLYPLPVLLVINPIPLMYGTIVMGVYAESISFTLAPFALKDVSVCICHFSFALHLIVLP